MPLSPVLFARKKYHRSKLDVYGTRSINEYGIRPIIFLAVESTYTIINQSIISIV